MPDRWNELSQRQLIRIMEIFHQDILVEKANVQFFRILSGISWFRMKTRILDVLENMHLVEWIYEETAENLLTRNLIPEYMDLYGPSDELNNVSAQEFFWADHFFRKWEETNDAAQLNMLVATLYRSLRKIPYDHIINPDNDHREVFNQNLIEPYCTVTQHFPMPVKLAIAKFFKHNFMAIRDKYPEPFEASGGQPSRFGFVALFRDVAEAGHHGQFADIEKMNVHLFFMELCIAMEKSKKL